ncbi:MAG: cysteine--tRNA ligase [Deltaproteobacteria bacterium]|nr:cysteine--tRNA ligase [Deltaproteobacteria bacterium]
MALRIYNTLSRKKELFEPVEPGRVRMYVCGPTVYDSCHIGHARSVVVFDVIARYLRVNGYDVSHVRNFTDVDDKIIDRANLLGIDSQAVAEKYIEEFYRDMDALSVERATIEPRATEHIKPIIRVIENLMEKGIAYQINGDVYFAVESFKGYGKLSGRRLEDMEAGARVDVDERKRNPFDFVLWKTAKPGEPTWDSPWGKGRPGWHIECTAMSTEYLGEMIDIHGGGKDLIFPHHENEIAQSEAAFGKSFVKYWVHNGFVNIEQEKMSKSLGNFKMIKDVIKIYHPETVRLFLLSNHYRSPVDFTEQAMIEADSGLEKMYALLERVVRIGFSSDPKEKPAGEYWRLFCEAMDDDFNTARGIGILFVAVREINRTLDENGDTLSPSIKTACTDILRIGSILGILAESPEVFFQNKTDKDIEKKSIDPAAINEMIEKRREARKAKDWKTADEIREKLEKMNIVLEDRSEGTVWKINKT